MSLEIGNRLPTGLTAADAKLRLVRYGANELPSANQRGIWAIAAEVVREPMFLLLAAGGAIYLILGDVREALILLASVFVVIGITIYQERKTERALEALRDLSSPRALVIRDGEERRIAGREVVPGDLVLLGEGDRVPADGALLQCNQFSVDESLLTGESLPVAKRPTASAITQMENPGGDDSPFVYSGSLVVQGQGIERVLVTGAHTQIGKIGKALQQLEIENTPLQRQTARVVRVFAAIGISLCLLVVVLYAWLRGGWLDGLLAGITLAMSVLPEEFPVVLTVFLALGAWRMSQKGVLTRRMPAVETLGSATVLCVDKTGTLTENRMAVAEVVADGRALEAVSARAAPSAQTLVRTAALACELNPSDPMDRAILSYATETDAATDALRRSWALVREYDLTPELLAVTHVWKQQHSDALVVASKGAPEAIARLCHADDALREAMLAQTAELAAKGRRVLAVAEARFEGADFPASPTEFRFSYLGLVALADPIRPTVPQALAECRQAGVRVVMITGDYPGTAAAIAGQIGLVSPGGVLTGADLSKLNDAELRERAATVNIFARVVPEQKLRLVNALKQNGEIVAMTGDGVNDAPALKAAHIGVAMGTRGTDVAREASALVLVNDDFTSIVETIRLGRRIFDNIRHAMAYLLAVHVAIAGMALAPLLGGWPLIFFPVHIVFLEFVIDPACSIAFEAEPENPDIMKRPPRDPREPLLGARLLWSALLQGIVMLATIILLYAVVLDHGFSEARARALAFSALVLGNIALIISNRSQTRTVLATLHARNRAVWVLSGAAVGGLLLSLYVPVLCDVFRFEPLAPPDLLFAAAAAVFTVLASEIIKRLQRRGYRASVAGSGKLNGL